MTFDYDYKDPAKYPSTVKPFAAVSIGEDCETFDGREGVILQKGTIETLFNGSSTIALALESEDFTGDEDAVLVQLVDADEPTVYPYGRESVFVRDIFHEEDF